jgi:hypothetical protein
MFDAAVSIFNSVHGDKGKSTRNTCMGFKNNMATNHLTNKNCYGMILERNLVQNCNKSTNLSLLGEEILNVSFSHLGRESSNI